MATWLLIRDNGDGTETVANAIVIDDDLTPAEQSADGEWIGWTRAADGTWAPPDEEG